MDGLASMVYKFFDKKTAGSGVRLQINRLLNLCLKMSNELKNFLNPLLKNLKKRSVFNIQRQYLGC